MILLVLFETRTPRTLSAVRAEEDGSGQLVFKVVGPAMQLGLRRPSSGKGRRWRRLESEAGALLRRMM